MNIILGAYKLKLIYKGEFFLNREGKVEELHDDHPLAPDRMVTSSADGDSPIGWNEYCMWQTEEPENGFLFRPYVSYIVEGA